MAVLSSVTSSAVVGSASYVVGRARGRRRQPVWVLQHVAGDAWTVAYTGRGQARQASLYADTLGVSAGQDWPRDDEGEAQGFNSLMPDRPVRNKQYPISGVIEGRGLLFRWLDGRFLCEGSVVVRAGDQRVELLRSDVNRDGG
jgi:hypothetical protein